MRYIFIVLSVCYFSVVGYTQNTHSIKADILLDSTLLNQLSINTKFINSIEYTSKGFILLSSPEQFYLLGNGGIVPIFKSWTGKTDIESFAVSLYGILLVVSGNTLYQAYSKPSFIKVSDIPDSNMGIISKYNNIFVYNRVLKNNKKDYSIYQVSKNKKITPLVTIPTPILSVFEQPSQLIFSTKNILFSVAIATKKLYQILVLPQTDDIISVVGDTINHAFYFSTDKAIYRIKDDKTELICNDFGGILKYDGEGLVIFNPEKQLIVRFRNNLLYSSANKENLHPNQSKDLPQLQLTIDKTPENANVTLLLNKPRNLILSGQISQAIQAYAQLIEKDGTNSTLLAEYAYALALNGIYEGALMNLDRAKLLGVLSEKDYFYAGQVFALMGYNQPATEFLTHCSVPQWIYPKYNELYKQYKLASSLPQEKELETAFRRTNYLASVSMYYQSIALYEQILEGKPDAYLFHVGYSIPLEKVGLRKLAAEELQTGISLMGDDPQYAEAKAAFNQRLEQLKQQPENATTNEQSGFLKKLNKFNPQTMLYAGGMFSENYTSFNARFGVFLSNSFNGAVNLGVSGNSTSTYFNLGLSGYQRLGDVLVLGLGLNNQISKENSVLSIAPSLGFSFINSKSSSSWDVFLNLYSPLQQGESTIFGISIGYSSYWGKR